MRPKPAARRVPIEVVRLCAKKWQAMKRGGAAQGLLWRDFSAHCYRSFESGAAHGKTPGRK
ncbi:MAG: hypothetical protein KGQ37_11885 [Hyphomicrobiales bacterium]|nr:hypothetical protein [Hyphomicrobiales bacterium]